MRPSLPLARFAPVLESCSVTDNPTVYSTFDGSFASDEARAESDQQPGVKRFVISALRLLRSCFRSGS